MSIVRNKYRTHSCSELRSNNIGETVTLSGWIDSLRNLGNLVFVDLRDDSGITQLVFKDELIEKICEVRVESTIKATGTVISRGELVNKERATGEIEIDVKEFELLGACEVLPFTVSKEDNAPENTRLEYRFLELRRERVRNIIKMRSLVTKRMRDIMWGLGFMEFQTPILTSSSPEGARDFLVPSRLHSGKFYALPQAPQIFKELITVSGFDNYFQVAPCFRDEDPRADRSPGEFYQLDLEMAFAEQEDIFKVGEDVAYKIFSEFSSWKVTKPNFPRISFNDAMRDYGSDKPDLRIKNKLKNITDIFKDSNFEIFKNGVMNGREIIALCFKVDASPSRKGFDEIVSFYEKVSKGDRLSYLIFENQEGAQNIRGSLSKALSEFEVSKIKEICEVENEGNFVVFTAMGARKKVLPSMGKLRLKLAKDFNQIEKNVYKFCWVVDFPMFEENEDTGKPDFCHNPFSMPHGGIKDFENEDIYSIYANQFDLVLNGNELASGAIRNHDLKSLFKAFEIVGYSKEVVKEKFASLYKAFRFGPPPHGGMALGIDRIIMLLADVETVRDVIMFPLSQTAEDLMMHAPSNVTNEQLRELHLSITKDEEE